MSERPARGRVAILISGRGSNMVALVEAMRAGRVTAEPVVVLANRTDAEGLGRAAALGVATEVVDQTAFTRRLQHEERVIEVLDRYRPDLICLAGYMRLLSPRMVGHYAGRMLNVHPSLLPAFPGLHAQRQALAHGARISGCTVHLVDEGCDQGPIVLQAAVPVLDDDTEETLSARILEQEHRLYPEAVALFVDGRLQVEGRRVRVVAAAPG